MVKMMGEEDYPHSILQNGLRQITDEETVAQGDDGCGNGG